MGKLESDEVWTPDGVVTGRLNIQRYKIRKIRDHLERLMGTFQGDYIFSIVHETIHPNPKEKVLISLDQAVEEYCKTVPDIDNLNLMEAVHEMKEEIKRGTRPPYLFY